MSAPRCCAAGSRRAQMRAAADLASVRRGRDPHHRACRACCSRACAGADRRARPRAGSRRARSPRLAVPARHRGVHGHRVLQARAQRDQGLLALAGRGARGAAARLRPAPPGARDRLPEQLRPALDRGHRHRGQEDQGRRRDWSTPTTSAWAAGSAADPRWRGRSAIGSPPPRCRRRSSASSAPTSPSGARTRASAPSAIATPTPSSAARSPARPWGGGARPSARAGRPTAKMAERAAAEYYPVLLDLRGRTCAVIGGGAVAEGKVERLLAAGAAHHRREPVPDRAPRGVGRRGPASPRRPSLRRGRSRRPSAGVRRGRRSGRCRRRGGGGAAARDLGQRRRRSRAAATSSCPRCCAAAGSSSPWLDRRRAPGSRARSARISRPASPPSSARCSTLRPRCGTTCARAAGAPARRCLARGARPETAGFPAAGAPAAALLRQRLDCGVRLVAARIDRCRAWA